MDMVDVCGLIPEFQARVELMDEAAVAQEIRRQFQLGDLYDYWFQHPHRGHHNVYGLILGVDRLHLETVSSWQLAPGIELTTHACPLEYCRPCFVCDVSEQDWDIFPDCEFVWNGTKRNSTVRIARKLLLMIWIYRLIEEAPCP